MTFSTLFLLMAGRRPSLTDRIVIQDTFTHGRELSLSSILKNLILFTFVMEVLGSVLLFLRFLPGRAVSETVYLLIQAGLTVALPFWFYKSF